MSDTRSYFNLDWILDEGILQPPVELSQDLLLWLSKREGDDSSITFEFSQPAAEPLKILSSRLEYVGGPFAAICQQPFAEKQSNKVALSAEDDPLTFGYIRTYLYMNPISPTLENNWAVATIDAIVKVIRAAHRWQLNSLFTGFCNMLLVYEMLSSAKDVVEAIDIARLPGVPHDLQVYFWTCVGEFYPVIAIHPLVENRTSKNVDSEDSEETWIDIINTKQPETINASMAASPSQFPDLWALAESQNMISYLLHSIVNNMMRLDDYDNIDGVCSSLYHDHLEMIVLGFLEHRINDDSHFLNVLSLLRWSAVRWTTLIQNSNSYKTYSSRAMALVATHLLSSNVPRDEFRSSWEISLHSLEDLYGMERHFLFPMSKVDFSCKQCGYAEAPEDTLRGECETGISFSISIEKRRSELGFSIDTRWNMIDVDFLQKDLSSAYAIVKIIDNKCRCRQWRQLFSESMGGVIKEGIYMLHDGIGLGRLLFDSQLLVEYRMAHGKDCRVTISVEVREG